LAAVAMGAAACAVTGVYGRQPSIARVAVTAPACGKERWAVKTLADPSAAKVKLGTEKVKDLAAMTRLKPPAPLNAKTERTRTTERTVYRVTGLLVDMRREDDSDIHLVIADPSSGATMIAEFPINSCTAGADEQVRDKIQRARSELSRACGGLPGSRPVTLFGIATITGVGYFDPIHGQSGVAVNGIELHPVLTFESADCSRDSPTPPPG
jgi:hypothetical protein